MLSSGTLSESNGTYTTSTMDQSAICVTGTSTVLNLTNPTITTNGATSSNDESSFYGLNAAVLNYNGGNLTISGGTITTTGSGGNDVFAYGTGTVTISNATVTASGSGGHGLYAAGGGTMVVNHVTASSSGSSGSIVATDRGGGTITITGGRYSATGNRSAGIYSTGVITATNAIFSASNAEAVVVEGNNAVNLIDSYLTAGNWSEHRGIMLYNSGSHDADNTSCKSANACFTMTGGTYTYTDTDDTNGCAAFVVTNQTAVLTLTDATVENSCGTLLASRAVSSNWGSSGSNGGTATFSASGETLTGSIIVDAISTATISLANTSTLTGAINNADTASSVILSLDASSKWVVTADSYLTDLTDADSKMSNITCKTAGCKVVYGKTTFYPPTN